MGLGELFHDIEIINITSLLFSGKDSEEISVSGRVVERVGRYPKHRVKPGETTKVSSELKLFFSLPWPIFWGNGDPLGCKGNMGLSSLKLTFLNMKMDGWNTILLSSWGT